MSKYITIDDAKRLASENKHIEYKEFFEKLSNLIEEKALIGRTSVTINLDVYEYLDNNSLRLKATDPRLLESLREAFPGFKFEPCMGDQRDPYNELTVRWV